MHGPATTVPSSRMDRPEVASPTPSWEAPQTKVHEGVTQIKEVRKGVTPLTEAHKGMNADRNACEGGHVSVWCRTGTSSL